MYAVFWGSGYSGSLDLYWPLHKVRWIECPPRTRVSVAAIAFCELCDALRFNVSFVGWQVCTFENILEPNLAIELDAIKSEMNMS